MASGSAVSGVKAIERDEPSERSRFETVLYVPTSPRERSGVRERLARAGVPIAGDLADAMVTLAAGRVTFCIVDLVGNHAALAAIRLVRAEHPTMAIVGVVDPSNPIAVAEAMQAGLCEVLPWPFDAQDLAVMSANVNDRAATTFPPKKVGNEGAATVVAHSETMRAVMNVVTTVAGTEGGVCLSGEAGTGRRFLAGIIHELGQGGQSGPFVSVDCGGGSLREVEERLFGLTADRSGGQERAEETERLEPTGAVFEARGGTLYVTNVTQAPARVQAKLARLLRDREASVGTNARLVDLDVRPIVGTDADLEVAVGDGRLRGDLHERFASAKLDMPPLRDRREDIPILALEFARDACCEKDVEPKTFSRSALMLLAALPWHGNAAELRGLVETLVNSVRRSVIQLDDLLEHASLDGMSTRLEAGLTLRDAKAKFERECISAVLRQHHGRVGEAAKALGIQRTNLYRKVRQLNVARSLLSARR